MSGSGILTSWAGRIVFAPLLGLFLLQFAFPAPAQAQMRFTYNKGQSVEPAFEGWAPNDDGSLSLYFGYMNPNWEQELDVPVGPANEIEPGGPDQGQPTHFYPRRNPFLFTIQVPKDFGNKELVWTLTSNGRTKKVYASLKGDYRIDKQVMSTEIGGDLGSLRDELRYDIPPELEIQGESRRTVRVGEPLKLIALAGDPDNLPGRRDGKPQPCHPGKPASECQAAGQPSSKAEVGQSGISLRQTGAERPPTQRAPAAASGGLHGPGAFGLTPPAELAVQMGPGLWVSWIVYRGKGSAVTFSPDGMETWIDTRMFDHSAWSPPFVIPEPPPDGKWETQATFAEPGTYTLRAVACDGSLFTFANVVVTVVP